MCVFAKKASFKMYGVICISSQRVHLYLVFVTIQAFLLVKKANEILSTSSYPSLKLRLFNFSYTPASRAFMIHLFNLPVYSHSSRVPMYLTTPINTFYLLPVHGSEHRGFALQCFSFVHVL